MSLVSLMRRFRSWHSRACVMRVLLCVALAGASARGQAATTPADSHLLLYSGFETGMEGWASGSELATWYGPTSGPYRLGRGAVQLVKNASVSTTLSTVGYQSITARVSLAGVSLERNKTLYLEGQVAGGSWQTLTKLVTPDDNGYFHYYQLSLPSAFANTTMTLRARLSGLLKTDYAYVDEIWVYGQPLGGPRNVKGSDCPQCVADFALYDPNLEDDGVWEEEVRVLIELFQRFGWTWQVIDTDELNALGLGKADARRFRGLIVPGGFATVRNRDVNSSGEQGIRDFVSSGGNYVGFCAGSFWATSTVTWAQTATGGGGTYNQSSDYTAYAYDLKLLNGVAQGPYGWSPWEDGLNPSLEGVTINLASPTMKSIQMPASTRFFYYGGPFFVPSTPLPAGYEVWAWAQAPSGVPSGATSGAGAPVVVHFTVGSGNVVLFSHHPEVLISSSEDAVHLVTYFDEDDMAWNLGGLAWEQQHLDSWNIVHAALQIAKNQPVEALTSLPLMY